MADDIETGVLVARITIERYLDDDGDRITATAVGADASDSLDLISTLGMIEYAKAAFLREECDG